MLPTADVLGDLLSRLGLTPPRTLVVLGSGMGSCFEEGERVELARFTTGVAGHGGRLDHYQHGDTAVLLSFGRRHLYEGVDREETLRTVRLAARLGCDSLLLTNAAGGLSPLLHVGSVMLIADLIGTMIGSVGRGGVMVDDGAAVDGAAVDGGGEEGGGDRVEMTRSAGAGGVAADRRDVRGEVRRGPLAVNLHRRILETAAARGIPLATGVYAGLSGPSYETRAEIRMLRRIGADAVGMSTVLEAAEGTRLGMRVVGLSLITNTLTDTATRPLDHSEVVDVGATSTAVIRRSITTVLDILHAPDNLPDVVG